MPKSKVSKPFTHIADLTPHDRNARKHSPRNIGTIADGLQEVGAARSIVVDENGMILAGNGTVEAAAQAGITRVRVIEADGNEIIAVQRRGLTETQKRRLALIDNRASEHSEWDIDELRRLDEESAGKLLDGLFSKEEREALFAAGQAEELEPLVIDKPTALVWTLVAIPLAIFPKYEQALEGITSVDGVFATSVVRNVDKKGAHEKTDKTDVQKNKQR